MSGEYGEQDERTRGGSSEAAERDELDAHVADDPALRDESEDLTEIVALLSDVVAEDPPAALRAQVLDAVAAIEQLPRDDRSAAADGGLAAVPAPAPGPSNVTSLASRRRRVAPLAVAAAAVALLAGGLVVRTLSTDDAEVDVAAVVDDDDAITIALDGTISTMRVVHSPDHGAVALVGDDVPALGGDQVYELWLIMDGTPSRVEIFEPSADGSVEVLMPEMTPPEGAAFAVTVEPAGGSDAPTGAVVAISA